MMNDQIQVRLYETGDAEKICDLLDGNSDYDRDITFWIWINRLLSSKKSIISIAKIGSEVVGHYCIIRREVNVNGEIFECGLGIHAFVHPDYRKKISITEIAIKAYEQAKLLKVDFLYGFPNANYRLIQEKIERWHKVSLFKAYEKKVAYSKKNESLDFNWIKIEKNNFEHYAQISNLIEDHFCVASIKTRKSLIYFVNRFILHPHNPYEIWFLASDIEAVAVVVTKTFVVDGLERAHIIEYFVKSEAVLSKIIDDFEKKFGDVDSVVHWPVNSVFENLLVEKGYTGSGFETFFGVKLLSDKSKSIKSKLLKFENWHLSMGDSDAF